MKKNLIIEAAMILAMFAIVSILNGCGRKPDDTAPAPAAPAAHAAPTSNATEGISIHVDRETGCQYVSNPFRNSALTPRMDRNGKQVCGGSK